MSSALIVGGDQINGVKQVLGNYGADHINHWSGRKSGDSNKVIPQDTKLIVLITNWVSHSFTYKVKRNAQKRGITIIYTPNGSKEQLSEIIVKNDLKPSILDAFNQQKRHLTSAGYQLLQ